MKKLFIVESMSKGRTIQRILGDEYKVVASSGHVRDLPLKRMGVDLRAGGGYDLEYEDTRKAKIAEILKLCDGASEVFLATDEDSEGEVIAMHLRNIIKHKFKDLKVQRVSTNEITAGGIRRALESPRDIAMNIVRAQQARRAIDRVVGYSLGDSLRLVLGQKKRVTSGRVQCAVLNLIEQHNVECDAFEAKALGWSVGVCSGESTECGIRMCDAEGAPVLVKREEAAAVIVSLTGTTLKLRRTLEEAEEVKAPVPFTTASLQREAYWRLGFTINKTM